MLVPHRPLDFSAMPPITVFAVSVGGLVIGVLLLRDGVRWLNESLERRDGPSVLGRIVESRVVGRMAPGPDGRAERTWHVQLAYEYQVRGQRFRGSRVAPGASWLGGGWWRATSLARRYQSGAEVRLYFDPSAPEEAVLEPRLATWSPWVVMLLGAGFAIGGAMGLAGVGIFARG